MIRTGTHAWPQIGAKMGSDIGFFRNTVNVTSSTPPAAPEDGNSAWLVQDSVFQLKQTTLQLKVKHLLLLTLSTELNILLWDVRNSLWPQIINLSLEYSTANLWRKLIIQDF